jgi:hypothetical protein
MEAKQVRDLMEAYASVYTQSEEQEVLSEDLQQTVGKALDVAAKNPVVKAIGKVIAPVGKGRGTVTKAEQEAKIKQNLNQDVDFFDLVKGHLLDEGFADTEEAALVIMANMSEEWKQSIVEGLTPLGIKTAGVVDDQRRGSTRDKDLKGTRDALDKMKDYPDGFPGVKGV